MIAEKTREESKRLLANLLDIHWPDIKQAYLNADGALKVGLSLDLTEVSSRVILEVTINFVADRVKETLKVQIDELQEKLFQHGGN